MDFLMAGRRGAKPGFWEIVLNAIPFPIYITDIDSYEILDVNHVMREKTLAVPGDKCYRVIYREDHPCAFCRIPELRQRAARGEEELAFEQFNEADDRWYQLREDLITWFDGRRAKYSIGVDITDLKMMQNNLAEAHAELTLKNQLAEEANRAKTIFLATMSHEIRTPMNGILGMAQLLLESDLTPTQREQVETLKSSSEALLTILNDVLDLSKLEAGRTEFERIPLNLKQIFDGVAALLGSSAIDKGLSFTCEIDPGLPPWLLGDAGRLRQILLNLVGNAIKFTEKGAVRVVARRAEAQGPEPAGIEIEFTVIDTGLGMDAATCSRLFQAFSQADTSISRRFGGTGLGLAICKRLVEAQGGEIGVDSALGQGSRFWFRLVFQPGTAPGTPQPSYGMPPLPPLSILLAEDDPVNQKVALAFLRKAGHQVTVVRDGVQAVKAAEAGGLDIILMDMQMPEMDGWDATAAIRRLPAPLGQVPVIALTANVMPSDVERYRQAGANAYVSKPFNPSVLFETIASLIRPEPTPSAPAGEGF